VEVMANNKSIELIINELRDEVNELKKEINDLRHEVSDLKERISLLEGRIEELSRRNEILIYIIKYVVTPMLFILGALVGVRLIIPT